MTAITWKSAPVTAKRTRPDNFWQRTIPADQIDACTNEAQLREWWKASDDATKAIINERVQILRHEAGASDA